MSERAPYSRVYWIVRSDPRLATIYSNDANFAAWTRLLLAADMAWPAPADIPAATKRSALVALEQAGVIELLPGGLFRFHGLDAERGKRKAAATTRQVPERGPNGHHPGPKRGPSRAEPSKDETRQADAHDPADAYWTLTGRYPTDRTLTWIDELAGQYGSDAVSQTLGATHQDDPTISTLLGRVTDALKRHARKLDLAERAAEEQRIAAKRAPLRPLTAAPPDVSEEEAARAAADYLSKHRAGDAA